MLALIDATLIALGFGESAPQLPPVDLNKQLDVDHGFPLHSD
jgi:hypothetical protein